MDAVDACHHSFTEPYAEITQRRRRRTPGIPDRARAARPLRGSAPWSELSPRERDILTFEREWWKYADVKDTAVRERLDLTPESYYRALNAIIDRPGALTHDPLLVRRLRRQRMARQRQRQARRHGLPGGPAGDERMVEDSPFGGFLPDRASQDFPAAGFLL